MSNAPAPAPAPADLKVTDATGDTAFLELEDGRHIMATVKDGVKGVVRSARVTITSDGLDAEGVPKNAVVTRVTSGG